MQPRSEWRRGWRVVVAALLGAGFGPGLYQNLSSLFTPGLEREFGWSRGDISTAAGLALVGVLIAPFVGRLADRVGVRPVIVASSAVLVAAYLLLASVGGAIWHYQACIVLLVLAVPGTSSLVYGKMIALRFRHHRGTALAIATSGLAVMTIIAAPALGWLIDGWGWRRGFVALGLASAAALPFILLVIRPSSSLAKPTIAEDGAPPVIVAGMSAAEARRDPRFWRIVIGAMLVNLATTGLVTQIVPLGLEMGLDSMQASVLLTAFGASAIAGRLLIGALIDRYRPQPAAAAFALVSAIAFVGLAWGSSDLAIALALVFLAGLMNGAENDLLPFLAARLFGLRAFGEIYGSAMPLTLVGTAIGIIGFGRLHDLFDNYDAALIAGAVALLGAGVCFLSLRDRTVPTDPVNLG
ncbi:MFS transporter [uncultured Sphingomonas sp.]|uniref:MFS transporter n=1 Tax=uncultured Sphingomonas sp. TaxID=158754 RepID=UPI0025DC0F2A|nr:MFS transporter [uncultured Sphingomonas sp.]